MRGTVVAALLVLAAACSTGPDSAATSTEPTGTSADTSIGASAGPADGFCTDAARFIDDGSVTDISRFSAQFFVEVDSRLSTMADRAPAAVRGDVETLRTGFDDMDRALAGFDYDLEDPGLAVALGQVDNEAMLAATDAIGQYLVDECGVAGGVVDPQQVADIQEAFGVDEELAECLSRELGDIANIDSGRLTPELMGRSVCGTSLIALLAGEAPGG